MVVFVWVEGVLGEDFSGVAVDDDGVGTGDEEAYGSVFVGSSDAEVA